MADGIPYPQAPRLEQQNPFQTISNLQAMDQRQQAMQQQEIAMRSKMAVGRHMQAHIDPQTGQLDTHAFMSSLAADPEAGPSFMEVHHMMKENGEIDERTMGMQLENQQKRINAISNMMAPLQAKVARGEPIDESALSGAIAMGISNGAFKNREDGLNTLLAWTGQAKGSPGAAKNIVLGMSQYTENARAALEKNMLDMQAAYKMRSVTTPSGETYEQPLGQIPGALPPGAYQGQPEMGTQEGGAPQAAGPQEQEIAEGGASAPRTMPSARQEGSPSAPPATPMTEVPRGAIRTSASPIAQAQLAPYKEYQEGKGWLVDEEKQAGENARVADLLEKRLNRQEELFRNFFSGPGGEARQQLAVFLDSVGVPKTLVQRVQGGSVAAAQEALKEIAGNTFDTVRQSLPGQRITNYEVQAMKTANYNLGTAKEAINGMMNSARKLIAIAREDQKGVRDFARFSRQAIEQNLPSKDKAFRKSEFDSIMRDHLIDMGLITPHEEEYDVTKKPGAR